MSFSSFVLTDSIRPTEDIMAQLQTVIDAHAAWVFVERVIGTGAVPNVRTTDVYKCLGSVNSFGTDFYIGFHRSGDAQGLFLIMGEGYNTTTKSFVKGSVYNTAAGAYNIPADWSYTTDRHVANETTNIAVTHGFLMATGGIPTAAVPAQTQNQVPVPGNKCWISISNDRIVLSFGQCCIYAGLYDTFYTTASGAAIVDPFPIVQGNVHPMTDGIGTGISTYQNRPMMGYTRELGSTGAALALAFSGAVAGPWMAAPPNAVLGQSKDPISQKFPWSKLLLTSCARRAVSRGLLKDVMHMRSGEMKEGVGDTIVVDGATFTCVMLELNSTAYTLTENFQGSVWVANAA